MWDRQIGGQISIGRVFPSPEGSFPLRGLASEINGFHVLQITFGYNVRTSGLYARFLCMGNTYESRFARLIFIAMLGASCALFLAAPLFVAHRNWLAAGIAYMFFSPVCHQIPARCFTLLGYPWAVCQRCAGIYLGAFFTALLYSGIPKLARMRLTQRAWVIVAVIPMLLDAGLPSLGLWSNTPMSRFSTGLLFGIMLSSLLIPAISEFISELRCKRRSYRTSCTQGGAA